MGPVRQGRAGECEVAEPSGEAEYVVVDAAGAGGREPGPGGWAAVLTYGRHRREIHDADPETTGERMALMAAVRGLECLTRPVAVRVRVAGGVVPAGLAARTPPEGNGDLWHRLYDDADAWVSDEYLTLETVTPDSLTFTAPGDDTPIGPIPVPPEIAQLAKPGWQILLTAARTGTQWHLVEVINGDP
jgi:ribonuclease HI